MKEFITVCPRNCYSTCSFVVLVDNNKITNIFPDKSNLAVSEGPCLKGLSYIERADTSSRITSPLIRKENGEFEPIDYTSALNIISKKLQLLKDADQQQSVLYYTGSGMSGLSNEIGYNFFNSFGGATSCYGNFCWPAGLEAVRLSFGEVKHNAPWHLEEAGLILIWGKNPAETNIQETVFIERASARGAKVVVIDPRRTASADKADQLYMPNPGTDAALALAVARILIDEEKIDSKFISNNVSGFEEYKNSLKITPDEAEEITGIPKKKIRELAQLIGDIKPMTIIAGFGMQRYTNGGQSIRALLSLCAITGNIGIAGSGFNYANLQGYVFDKIKEPESYYPDVNANPLFRRAVSMAKLGKDLLSIKDPKIKLAWIERGNPVTQAPDTNKVVEAFSKIEFKVVVDQFMTDTARLADIILPAKNMFEQQDLVSSYWSPYISFRPKVLDPPDSVLPESVIFYKLAKLLDLKFTEDEIPTPGDEALDLWLERRISGLTEYRLDDYKAEKRIVKGIEQIAYHDLKFSTPSGKIELLSNDANRLWNCDKLPAYSKAFKDEKEEEGSFIFLSPNTKNRIHSQFGNLDVIKENDPEPLLQINHVDANRLGLLSRELVRVYNNRGEIQVKIDITSRIKEGCVSMPNGWWISENGGGNYLSEGRETDMGFGTAFHDNRVQIEKLSNA